MNSVVDEDVKMIVSGSRPELEMLTDRTVMITGGTGFVARYLIHSILTFNETADGPIKLLLPVRSPQKMRAILDRTTETKEAKVFEWQRMMETGGIPPADYVIHAASPSDPAKYMLDPHGTMKEIISLTEDVVAFAQRSNTSKLLYISSGAVYGKQPSAMDSITEDYMGGPDLTSPASCYGEAKRYSELLVRTSGLESVSARLFSFIGPYQDEMSSFAVPDFLHQALSSSQIFIRGDGSAVRGYCYSSELAIMLWKLLLKGSPLAAYNVGSDRFTTSMKDLATNIARIVGDVEVRTQDSDDEGRSRAAPSRYVPNMDRMRTIFEPTIDIESALRRTVRFLQEERLKGSEIKGRARGAPR